MSDCTILTRVGNIMITEEDGAIVSILFLSPSSPLSPPSTPLLEKAVMEIEEYFAKKRTSFTLPLSLRGTEFQKKVWRELASIPYGETMTYGDIGKRIGKRGYQAIGQAVGHNPIPIIIPCHRVVAAGGIGGFSGGLWRKKVLMETEDILI